MGGRPRTSLRLSAETLVTNQVLVQPAAEADIVEAALWYENHAAGLGNEFLRSVEIAIASIRRTPGACPRIRGDVRRVLLRRFPFALYFLPEPSAIRVIACLHARRDPGQWQRRIEGETHD